MNITLETERDAIVALRDEILRPTSGVSGTVGGMTELLLKADNVIGAVVVRDQIVMDMARLKSDLGHYARAIHSAVPRRLRDKWERFNILTAILERNPQ